jgi:hypothetical protein
VTLFEFYGTIADLADRLRLIGRGDDGKALNDAVRGGSTSGEILTNVGVVLRDMRDVPAGFRSDLEASRSFVQEALHPR